MLIRFVPLLLALPLAAALQVTVLQGEGAIHNIEGKTFVEPLISVTTGGAAIPVPGASVTFLVPEIGPSGRLPTGSIYTTTTNGDGLATVRGFQPNKLPGQWEIRVTVSHAGEHASARIPQINAAPLSTEAFARSSRSRFWLWTAAAGGAAAGLAAAFGSKGSAAVSNPAPQPPAASAQPAFITTGTISIGKP